MKMVYIDRKHPVVVIGLSKSVQIQLKAISLKTKFGNFRLAVPATGRGHYELKVSRKIKLVPNFASTKFSDWYNVPFHDDKCNGIKTNFKKQQSYPIQIPFFIVISSCKNKFRGQRQKPYSYVLWLCFKLVPDWK